MKFILFILMVSLYQNGYCQSTPKVLEFENIVPEWYYLSKDSNFIKNPLDLNSSPYWGKTTANIKDYNENLIILESTNSQSPAFGPAGMLLHSINKNTGQPTWIHHWNEFSGLKNREDYIDYQMSVNDSDEIMGIGGCRDIDSMETNFTYAFECVPTLRKISLKNGYLEEQLVNMDSSFIKCFGGYLNISKFVMNEKKDLFLVQKETGETDTAIVNHLRIIPFNEDLSYDIGHSLIISDTTTIPIDVANNFVPIVLQSNPNTIFILFGDNDINFNGQSPTKFSITAIDISDKNNIKINTFKKDIRDLLVFPQPSFSPFFLSTYDGGLLLSQQLSDDNLSGKFWSYLRWLDNDGNVIASFDTLYMNEKYYFGGAPLREINNELYFFAPYIESGNLQYDILKIDKADNNLSFVKEIIIRPQNNVTPKLSPRSYMDKSGNLYSAFRCEVEGNDLGEGTNYIQYFKISSESLGISTNTTEAELANFEIFPNPATQYLTFKSDGQIEMIELFNEVTSVFRRWQDQEMIEISDLENGLYFLKIRFKDNSTTIRKFVKM